MDIQKLLKSGTYGLAPTVKLIGLDESTCSDEPICSDDTPVVSDDLFKFISRCNNTEKFKDIVIDYFEDDENSEDGVDLMQALDVFDYDTFRSLWHTTQVAIRYLVSYTTPFQLIPFNKEMMEIKDIILLYVTLSKCFLEEEDRQFIIGIIGEIELVRIESGSINEHS